MKTPRNKSFLSHLLGWISEEASDDMNRVAKKNGGGMVAGMGGFSFCLPIPLGAN